MDLTNTKPPIKVKRTDNFSLENNDILYWNQTNWIKLTQLDKYGKSTEYETKVKILYSDKGLYFLFVCEDNLLNASYESDFSPLWKEDVVEVFIWPDENFPVYFEYEISPLNYELPLMVSNIEGEMTRWVPFMYEENRKTRHSTIIEGGPKRYGASIKQWTAKFFIPYKLLRPLNNIPPKKDTQWNINLYRIDYTQRGDIKWAWQPISKSFHEYHKFGTLIFT